jgi:hypothetical protein
MTARKVTITVECSDPDTGEMALSVDRENVPEDEAAELMILHPAELDLLYELIDKHKQTGGGFMQSLSLNVPEPA